MVTEFIYLDGVAVAQISGSANVNVGTGVLTYIHPDHQGTPRVMSDGLGQKDWLWVGDAFGHSPPNSDLNQDGSVTELRLRFPGQYFDPVLGAHYNYWRDYDPNRGRYMQSDPVSLAGGMNSYVYAFNAPTKYTDPLGLWSVDVGFYIPFGGSITVYGDGSLGNGNPVSLTGLSLQVGVGLKGSYLQYDPAGQVPKARCQVDGNASLGVSAQVGGAIGPWYAGGGLRAGLSTDVGGKNNGLFPFLPYSGVSRGYGVTLEGASSPRMISTVGLQAVIPFDRSQ